MLACNGCWCGLDTGNVYIAACDHVYCEKDIHIALEQRQCMVCGTKVAERDVQVVELQPDLVVLQRKLAGLCPNDMLTAVAHGIKFWDDQLELRYRTELEKSFTAAQRNSEMYKRKLQDVHTAYKKAKLKQDELYSQLKEREKDIEELQHRYEEKSREKRRLEDSAGRKPSALGGSAHFQQLSNPIMSKTSGRIETRAPNDPKTWENLRQTSSDGLRDRRSSEQFYTRAPDRRASFNRSIDTALTPPTTNDSRDPRGFRPLSPYSRQPEAQKRPRESGMFASKRRAF